MKNQNFKNLKIEKEIALQICSEIIAENKKKRFSFLKIFCGQCKSRCLFSNDLNRGCPWVNKRFDKLIKNSNQFDIMAVG